MNFIAAILPPGCPFFRRHRSPPAFTPSSRVRRAVDDLAGIRFCIVRRRAHGVTDKHPRLVRVVLSVYNPVPPIIDPLLNLTVPTHWRVTSRIKARELGPDSRALMCGPRA